MRADDPVVVDGARCATLREEGKHGLSRTAWIGLSAAFAVIGLALYAPVLFSWYSSDDFIHYATVIEGGLPFVPAHPGGGFLRPLVGLGFWLDYRIWGLNPFPAHLFNIFLHIANSLLVMKFAIVIRHGRSRRNLFGPIAAGLLFLVLGCHGEPVSWISSRGDLLALCFSLLVLINFSRGLQTGVSWRWIASLACLALALLSKESSFATPLLAFLCWARWRGEKARRSLERRDGMALAANVVLVGVYLLFRKWMVGGFVGGYGARGHLRFHHDLVAQSLGHFAWRVFLPPLPAGAWAWLPPMEGVLAITYLGALALSVLLLLARRRGQIGLPLFCFSGFLLALVPVINVRIYLDNTEGERYLYLASVFAALGMGLALGTLPNRRLQLGLLAIMALLQSAILSSGVRGWREAATIARSVVTGLQELHHEGPMILVNKPDACGGALVFRTGLPEALRYFGTRPIPDPEIEVLFAAGLSPREHGFRFGPVPGGEAGMLELAATDPRSGFSEEDRNDRIEVLRHSGNTALFRFREPLHDTEVFYYDSLGVKVASLDSTATPTASVP